MVDGYCYFTTDDGQFYIDYLDTDGVTLRRKSISGSGKSIEYIIGTQTAATGSWAGITKDSELVAGKTIAYKLPYAGSGNASLTLTFTNPAVGDPANSGAIPVYINTSRTTTHYGAGSVVMMTYDGTNWRTTDYWNANDTTTTYARFANGAFAPITSLYRYQLLLSHPTDSSKVIPANTTSNTTGTTKATITTESFNPFDYIYYYNTTGTVSANTNISVSYVWYGHPAIDLRYSFNTGSTLVANKDIYLVAKLQSDGTAKLRNPGATGANASAQATGDDAGPVTQILPSTEDGYIYIKIGHAYDTYRMVLTFNHPIYVFKDGGIRPYSYFTDENVEQIIQTDNAEHKILITTSDSPTSGESTAVGYGENLAYNPSLNRLSTGNLRLTGELDVTGNAYLHNQTAADSLTAGSLLVTGNANFTQSPTAPTPVSTSNDTTVATTEFVKSNIAAGVTGVKGNAESSYRVGNVNLTPANIGALALTGGTLTGTLNISVGSAGYTDSLTAGGLNLNNSNIYGLNSIYTADASDNAGEGIHFYRDSTHVDTLWISGGNIYFVPNRAIGTGTTAANSEKVTRLPASITTGRAVYTDGTTGKLAISSVTSTELGYLSGVTSAIQTQLNAKAPLASPALTGTPTAPTAAAGTNTTQIATTAFVANSIASLSTAMHFIGKATVAITDGSTTDPTISGYDFTADRKPGDVIIDTDNAYEYVWTYEGKWERLGPDGSYKITQSAVDTGAATTNKWVSRIQQNANGVVTATLSSLDTSGTWSGKAAKLTDLNSSDSASSTTGWRKVWFSYSDGVTGRPALSDVLAFQTSTGTLKATIFSGSGASLTDLNASNISSGTLAAARLPSVTRTNNTSTASPAHSGTFTTIDSITTDTYGRVTAVNTKTITLPSDNNTDTKVTQTVASDNANYAILTKATTAVTTVTDTSKFSANVTINPSTGNLNASAYNSSIRMARVKAWGKTGPYEGGWKRVCALQGYGGYGIGRVYINGSWSSEEPTLAAFEISFSNTNYAHIKQTLGARTTTPDQVRLVYSGTGGKWYFDIHIPARTASSSTGDRYVTFVGRLTASEIDETTNLLTEEPTTTTVTRSLVITADQPTITVDLASTTAGAFTGANMTTGISGTLAIGHGGTGRTAWDIYKITYASAANTLGQLEHASSTSYLLRSGSASAAPSWIQYTNANTASTIVQRDGSGNFSAGTITANLNGNATTATKATQDGSGNTITSTYVKKAGDTMSGSLQVINTANNTAGLKINIETQSYNFGLHMGTGGTNHGLYDFKASKWIVLGDASHNWTFKGNADTATSASKLSNTSKIGDTNKPVYFTAGGVPAAISYTIDKSVPSNAVFTDRYVNSASFTHDSTNNNIKMTLTRAGSDTVTVVANIPNVSATSAGVVQKGAVVDSQNQSTKFLREDGTWAAPSYTVITIRDWSVNN